MPHRRSPGALYPTNRALTASRRMRWFTEDEGEKENHLQQSRQLLDTRSACQRQNVGDGRLDVMCRALAHPDCMRKCGWRHVVLLRTVSASLKTWVESGEDAWKTLAQCLADDAGLYVPRESSDWKRYFFEHLYPARHKWDVESGRISDHRISVAVRFKPGTQRERSLVLPLHQRLKMLKKGEKISAEEAAGEKGLSVDEVKAHMVHMAGADLDADVLEMLQDAANLQHAASRAEMDACNQEGRVLGDKWDTESVGGGAGSLERQPDLANEARAAEAGGRSTENSSGNSPKTASNAQDAAQDDADAQRRRAGRSRILSVERSKVVAFVPGVGVRPFNFAHVFDKEASQEALYAAFAQNAVLCALNGFNASVLAYGQTGSGKTFSLFGPPGWLDELRGSFLGNGYNRHGIVVRTVRDVLEAAERMREAGVARIAVTAQYVQVYREVVTCLGTGEKATLRAGGSCGSFTPVGAAEVHIDSADKLIALLERGEEYKRYGATAMNDRSSRAHTVLLLNLTHVRTSNANDDRLRQAAAEEECLASRVGGDGGEVVKSQLLLADLAGCEHISKSKVSGDARREAASINSGLLVLKKCISALNQEKSHVPFLESKLTMLLKGALGGSSRTFALVTGSLDEMHGDETVEALRFGEQCAGVTNQLRTQASSLPAALAAIDKALAVCQHGLDSLSSRGKSELAAYKALQVKYAALSRKRADLAGRQLEAAAAQT